MMGNCTIIGATLRGVDAQLVRVEVSIGQGIPGFCIVGMPDTAVQEARERVRSAVKASDHTVKGICCGFR